MEILCEIFLMKYTYVNKNQNSDKYIVSCKKCEKTNKNV